jgi:hypothetical protein
MRRTCLGKRENFSHVSHEDSALELQFVVLVTGPDQGLILVLFVLALVRLDLFAAEQDAFEEVYFILIN